MAATDFFAVEVWTPRGLKTFYVLFIIHLSIRSAHIAGVTTAPNGTFMKQVARNLIDVDDGFLSDSCTSLWTAIQNTRLISEVIWMGQG